MEVQVISKTVQKFNGESFYLCGNYFQHKGKRLHRTVWEYHNGEIPQGYHIHHKDGDRSHNDIANLELINGPEHLSQHLSMDKRKDHSRETIKIARAKASEWHGSEEGKVWHSKRGKENWENRTVQTYTCSFCGNKFQTKHIYSEDSNHFCHPNCKAAYRRRRLRGEG